jgi:hypothetical protein
MLNVLGQTVYARDILAAREGYKEAEKLPLEKLERREFRQIS